MDRKFFYLFTFLLFYLYQPSTVMAQGMVTEIKVVAVQDYDSLATQSEGYSGGDKEELDFRHGRGGGYVFALFKQGTDVTQYITDVRVTADREDNYGQPFSDKGKDYTPAPFFQAEARKDKQYRGGLNGRDYLCYGGKYKEQHHIYVSRTGNDDFSKQVLKSARVTTSRPEHLSADESCGGGYAGGGRYIVYEWHTHESKYKTLVSHAAPTGDINSHVHYCDRDQCGLTKIEPHRFVQIYGNDQWMQLPATDKLSQKSHYKKCLDCGKIIYDDHQWASFVSNWEFHEKRCLLCDYVDQADHKNFGKQKLPVDEYHHIIFCDDCGFIQKLHHDFMEDLYDQQQDCEHTIVKLKCRQCYHYAYFEMPGAGHDYDAYGICRRKGCLHPYEQPAVEPLGNGDSTFVVKSFGNLYWVADYVNNRRPKTNVRLDNDLIADSLMKLPWRPIGATDETPFQGTFDGGGHVITMLQTEEPVAGVGYRGLFGTIAKGATVKNVSLASCNMRGWNYVGGLAGINEGTIDACNVVFSVMSSIGTGMNLGGICGLNRRTGTITNCTTGSNVWVGGVRDYAGGICGTNDGGTLSGNVTEAICGSGSDAVLPETASQQ